MTEFIPKGFVGLPKAIWFLANRFDSALWNAPDQDPRELSYWTYLIEANDAKWLEDRIRYAFFRNKDSMPAATSLRIESYYNAEGRLRQALFANEIKAYFVSAAAETAGELLHILPEGWGTDAGQEILWYGRADLVGEPSRRIVFVDVYSTRTHFLGSEAEANPTAVTNLAQTSAAMPKRRGRPPAYDWPAAELYARKLLAHHGSPNADDPEFPNMAAFEGMISQFFADRSDRIPSESTVRERVKAWLDAYLAEAGN